MTTMLTDLESLKFRLLAEGVTVTDAAREHVREIRGERPITPADFASTSGVILRLEGEVWVNAPVIDHNPNFVTNPRAKLDRVGDGLRLLGPSIDCEVGLWLPPDYHQEKGPDGEPYVSYAFSHGDRVRIAPVEGCAMTCTFCNLPYDFRYRTKRVEGLLDSVRAAMIDPWQPASHVLISGGTPRRADVGYVREVYERVIAGFPQLAVDIMMVPEANLMDPEWLDRIGVHEISVNIEVFGADRARQIMRKKAAQGLDRYLEYLERAAEVLGGHRVRSMMMVGLEPIDDTLAGVEAIAARSCIPVLSPFRPDPSTPLASHPPPGEDLLREVYLRASDIAAGLGTRLGPDCAPCTHNTINFAGDESSTHGEPRLV